MFKYDGRVQITLSCVSLQGLLTSKPGFKCQLRHHATRNRHILFNNAHIPKTLPTSARMDPWNISGTVIFHRAFVALMDLLPIRTLHLRTLFFAAVPQVPTLQKLAEMPASTRHIHLNIHNSLKIWSFYSGSFTYLNIQHHICWNHIWLNGEKWLVWWY